MGGGREPVGGGEVEDFRVAAEDGGDDAAVAGEAAGRSGGEGAVALDVGGADPGLQRFQGGGDDETAPAAAAGGAGARLLLQWSAWFIA